MKKILIVLMAMPLFSCQNTHVKKEYYIVGKEYFQGGMCHNSGRFHNVTMGNLLVVTPIIVTPKHVHHMEKSRFVIHIARPHDVGSFDTDSISFLSYKCGQKIKH